MVGVAALLSVESAEKEVADSNPTDERAPTNDAKRKFSKDDIEERDGVSYVRGETTPFTGTTIRCFRDGSKFEETLYKDGKKHGMDVEYSEYGSSFHLWEKGKSVAEWKNGKEKRIETRYYTDGSKRSEHPYLFNKKHGTATEYYEDGSKQKEIVYENDKRISEKRWDKDGNQTHPKP